MTIMNNVQMSSDTIRKLRSIMISFSKAYEEITKDLVENDKGEIVIKYRGLYFDTEETGNNDGDPEVLMSINTTTLKEASEVCEALKFK